ncbi:PulJ/GspJ family protein [Desulfosediminicola sp.]|uniref:PulJ/GspJ family protein n=1 Tax=Desulfosediminicola sp. TaxID=2886825 RepID=UPI003AF2B221
MTAPTLRSSCRAGFTLLELLVSIAIFAVVISSVYGAYRATFHTISGTDKQVLRAAAARVILERVTEDLEALYTGEDGFFEAENKELGDGRADTLKFMSSAHLVFTNEQIPAGKTSIEYKVREAATGGFELIRIDTPQLPGQEDSVEDDAAGDILGKGLQSFSLSYFSQTGEQSDDWQSGGESAAEADGGETTALELPVLVRVEITFLPESGDGRAAFFRTSIALPQVHKEQESQEES